MTNFPPPESTPVPRERRKIVVRLLDGNYRIVEAAPGVGVTIWPKELPGVVLPDGAVADFVFDREENLMILYRQKA